MDGLVGRVKGDNAIRKEDKAAANKSSSIGVVNMGSVAVGSWIPIRRNRASK